MIDTTHSLWSFFWKASFWIKLKLVLLIALGISIVVGSSGAIYVILKSQRKVTLVEEVVKGHPEAESQPEFAHSYELKEVSIPLVNRATTRISYAQFTLWLDCPSAEAKKAMELNRPKILDRIFEAASGFYLEDFTQPKGFELFKGSLMKQFKADYKELAPRQIAIQNWLLN